MPGFFDRLGKAAQQTAAEGKLRLDIRNLQTQLDDRARSLGHLMFRQNRGEEVAEEEYTKLLDEMNRLESERQAKEVELEDLHRPEQPAAPAPAAAPAAAATPPPAPAPAPAQVACPGCGAANAPTARFCAECGRPLAAAAQ